MSSAPDLLKHDSITIEEGPGLKRQLISPKTGAVVCQCSGTFQEIRECLLSNKPFRELLVSGGPRDAYENSRDKGHFLSNSSSTCAGKGLDKLADQL